MPSNHPPLVFSGDVFGYLTVIEFSHLDRLWRRQYLCKCKCGRETTVVGASLRTGNTKSCGCLSEERGKRNRLSNNRGVINQIILQSKRHARERSIDWNLPFEFVNTTIRMPCHYCENPAGNLYTNRHNPEGFPYNGLDRVDSSLGYAPSNVVPCCRTCNLSKLDMSITEFRDWVIKVSSVVNKWGALL